MPAIAEDSGLEMDALDGAPGDRVGAVRRRRDVVSGEVRDAVQDARRARQPRERGALRLRARGGVEATRFSSRPAAPSKAAVAPEPRGTHGFGYDPIFFYPPEGRTLAEVSDDVKRAVSHRGAAFRQLRNWLDR